jgi:sterol desaturase/sphingolipid hydroxylase (fatty acid hydroxylase superfamily)
MNRFFNNLFSSLGELTLRYLLFAGVAWMLGYWIFKSRWFHRKIISKYPDAAQIKREMRDSAVSMVVFATVSAFTILAARQGWTQMYRKLDSHGWTWFGISLGLAILLHDTWFYWSHRAMHHPRLFRWFHQTHHLSKNPTPWASYAFSPLEAFIQASIFPLVMFLIPMHLYAFGLFMLWQIIYNVAGHTGYEYHPSWLMDSWLGKVLNTPTNHIMHHETLRGNYGLYFNIWDRLMGTNHTQYENRFREVTARSQDPHPRDSRS